MYDDWKPYVPLAQRRKNAERELAKLKKKKGEASAPITLHGRLIAKTFWGKAWCDNLEAYSDYANRLPRGRTYVRNGSVVDLQVRGGEVEARVSGSSLYRVTISVAPITKPRWQAICKDCAGSIDSLVELLQGRLSTSVMERVCQQRTGLFPSPSEIKLDCSCPDWADMCKHVAAVLYGIGARLDEQPALIFKLRAVDETELIASAARGQTLGTQRPASAKVLDADLSALFGLEIEPAAQTVVEPAAKPRRASSVPASKAVLARKAAPAKQPAPARKAAPAKRVAPAKRSAPAKTTTPTKQAAPAKKAAPAKRGKAASPR